ncbi:hypothetical protein TNCV_4520931 [Trichonephila clavipes]|nr:hypothetical protein TNCV_4520931 [Trichonephila clavipes]
MSLLSLRVRFNGFSVPTTLGSRQELQRSARSPPQQHEKEVPRQHRDVIQPVDNKGEYLNSLDALSLE